MATVIRTQQEIGHWEQEVEGHFGPRHPKTGKREWFEGSPRVWVHEGWETVSEKTLQVAGARQGGVSKRVAAWQAGTGRRNQSAHQVKARASGYGVLAPKGTVLVKDPTVPPETDFRTGMPALSEPDRVPVVYPPVPEGDISHAVFH
jgi:hypothetical protein